MLDLVGELIRNLLLLFFVVVLLELLMPQGQFNRYLRMVAGLLVILMILTFAGVLLKRLPAEKSLAALAEQTAFTAKISGTELWRLNREQALELYRANLAEMVCRIVAEEGGGRVSAVHLEVEHDQSSPAYGTVLALEITVEREMSPAPPQTNRAARMPVPPVRIAPFGQKETCGEPDLPQNEAGRLPVLERILSERLQLPSALIVVRESGAAADESGLR